MKELKAKMKTKIIVDPGSCHYGDKYLAQKLIYEAKRAGADAIKFQLFKDIPPNIPLPYHWMKELSEYGAKQKIEVFASVWDDEGLEIVNKYCSSVKLAYSKRNSALIEKSTIMSFKDIYVSQNTIVHNWQDNPKIKYLLCIPHEYPLWATPCFGNAFNGNHMFQGFSDHTMGISAAIDAVKHGATYIEKHFHIPIKGKCCADAVFAITPKELKIMCEKIKNIQKKEMELL